MERDPNAIPAGALFRTQRGGRSGVVGRLLGAGGQGAVYAAQLHGVDYAIKWYHPSYAAVDLQLRDRLQRAIERGAPDQRFLWPIDLVEVPDRTSFGYLMRLREADYAGMRELIARPPARISPRFGVQAAMCCHIAQSFLELHASGFCYQDINFGNIFFEPRTGDIAICDNDNVDVDGAQASVFGTRKFMAPEIVRREAMPGTKSDLYSMAVLFFYVMHAWHPLDGKIEAGIPVMDAAAEMRLYGTEPRFLFDPQDRSNGPLTGMHEPIEARWNALPSSVRALFVRAFTVGMRQPASRVQEAEWRAAFIAMATAGFTCPVCRFEHAVEVRPGAGVSAPAQCCGCGARLVCPPVLHIGRMAACLAPGDTVPRYLTAPGSAFDPSVMSAVVVENPKRPGIYGLQNRSSETWRVRTGENSLLPLPPGSTVRLLPDTAIDFGNVSGTIIMPESIQQTEMLRA